MGYGGEDWELAHRAWLAGAEPAHEPAAVAWHDGPDAGARPPDPAARTREALWLAERVADPLARDPALVWSVPGVAVDLDDRGWPPETVLLTCAGLLAGGDVRVWLRDGALLDQGLWPAQDPRVAAGPVPAAVLAGTPVLVDVDRPVGPAPGTSLVGLARQGDAAYPGLRVVSTRNRSRGVPPPAGDPARVVPVTEDRRLAAVWGGWA